MKKGSSCNIQINDQIFRELNSILYDLEEEQKSKPKLDLRDLKEKEFKNAEFECKYYQKQVGHLKQKSEELIMDNKSLVSET